MFLFISKSTFIQKETFVEQPNWQIYEQAILQTRGKREWNLVNTKKCTILSRVQSYLDHVIIWLCHHVIILLFSILVHMARLTNIIRLLGAVQKWWWFFLSLTPLGGYVIFWLNPWCFKLMTSFEDWTDLNQKLSFYSTARFRISIFSMWYVAIWLGCADLSLP